MADLQGSYYWSGGPTMRADVSYSQTGRAASTATYRVSVSLYFTSSGWFGYGLIGTVTINGKAQSITFKNASPTWSGAGLKGTWTFDIVAPAGTGGGTLAASFRMLGQQGDITDINTGSRTVSLSSWNTAPAWTGEGNVNSWTTSQIIPENTSTVTVNVPAAKDAEGNTIYTDIARYVNGSRDKTVAGGTTARTVSDNITAVAQGGKIKYSFYMSDGALANSTTKFTIEHTKNKFNPAGVATGGTSIDYNTASIPVTIAAASNLNGNTSFTYTLSTTSGPKIYNPTVTGSTTLTIHKSGTAPTTPYILWSELKNHVSSSNWKGSITVILTSANIYGSSGTSSSIVNINLVTNPTPATLATPTGTATVKGAAYYLVDRNNVNLSWTAAVDKLGSGTITYKVYYKVGAGGWALLKTTTTLTAACSPADIGAISAATTISFKIEAITTYGTSATSAEKSITGHYHTNPTVIISKVNRTETTWSVEATSRTNTSISTVAINRRYYMTTGGTTEFAGSPYTITHTGLAAGTNMYMFVYAADDSGLATATGSSGEIYSTVYKPLITITDERVAINIDPDSSKVNPHVLMVGGDIGGSGVYDYDTRVYSPMNKPSGDEIPYVPLSGSDATVLNSSGGDATLTLDRNKNASWKLCNKSGTLRIQCDWDSAKGAYFDVLNLSHSTGDVNVARGDFSVPSGKHVSASALNLNGYKNWDTGGFASSGGGAAIANDNGSYKCLMILGNSSAGGNRKIKMWDDLTVYGPVNAQSYQFGGSELISTGTNTNGTYTRYYDGTQVCTKIVAVGNIAITGAWGGIYGSGYKALGNWAASFTGNPFISSQLTTDSASAFLGTIKSDTASSAGSVELYRGSAAATAGYFWIQLTATGRWK